MNTAITFTGKLNLEELHDAQIKAEQLAEDLDKERALANLMNVHTDTMSISQITDIFAHNPPLAAHIMCKKIKSLNSMMTSFS